MRFIRGMGGPLGRGMDVCAINTMKLNHGLIIKEYESGKSCREIAKNLDCTRWAIEWVIRKKSKMRNHLGFEIEDLVFNKLTKSGYSVTQSEYRTSPYDLMVNGKRIDVKCAHKTFDKYSNRERYCFQLQDITNRKSEKKLNEEIDEFYFVFLDEKNIPVYSLPSHSLKARKNLTINNFESTKYGFIFLTNLVQL